MIREVWRCGSPTMRSTVEDKPAPEREDEIEKHRELPDEIIVTHSKEDTASLRNREEASKKMNSRDLAPTVSYSPFAKEEDYIKVLDDQDFFLRPKSSHDT